MAAHYLVSYLHAPVSFRPYSNKDKLYLKYGNDKTHYHLFIIHQCVIAQITYGNCNY